MDLTIKIGGGAGQGIQTVGTLLALTCRKAGYHIMAINDFESRIRGGHSFFQIRISDQPVQAPHHVVDLLVALNQETCDLHREELSDDGLVIIDAESSDDDAQMVSVHFNDIAKKSGGAIYSNTVAAAACLALMGASFDLLKTILEKQFEKKSEDILNNNLKAAELGFKAVEDVSFKHQPLSEPSEPKGALIEGSKAVALGAAAADCRLASFYPMSPATSILSHLNGFSGKLPLVVEQAEDEIAAVNMIIGASFAGVRAMTATSGGGFCLMTEGLGLAAISETPIVIVDAQRPGPATGLPTRTAQGDLNFVIHASQDDFPRFVFAPGTPEQAFELTIRSFHLAEKYQVPVIILTDQYLMDSLYILETPFKAPDKIERFIITDSDMEDPKKYERFKLTESGISPRALPCNGEALVLISSDEHTPDGHITEDKTHRTDMVDKRNAKLPAMLKEMTPPEQYHADAQILLVGWGSTAGAIYEAVDILREKKMDAGCLIFTDLWPFPADAAEEFLSGEDRSIWMIEQNQTAQLGGLIRRQTGIAWTHSFLKYDGRPVYPVEIVDAVESKEKTND